MNETQKLAKQQIDIQQNEEDEHEKKLKRKKKLLWIAAIPTTTKTADDPKCSNDYDLPHTPRNTKVSRSKFANKNKIFSHYSLHTEFALRVNSYRRQHRHKWIDEKVPNIFASKFWSSRVSFKSWLDIVNTASRIFFFVMRTACDSSFPKHSDPARMLKIFLLTCKMSDVIAHSHVWTWLLVNKSHNPTLPCSIN